MLSGPHHPHLRTRRPSRLALLSVIAVAAGLALLPASPASATAPRIPHQTTAQAELDALPVAAERSLSGYSRDLFPHWTSSGGCTTRQRVLIRDGIDVVVDASCQPVAGRWFSPYDGVTLFSASDVDIDHVVPLAEAWRSGADSWATSRRRSFANDLYWPQLRAASDTSNQVKGDRDPASWQPRAAYHCTYSKMWIRSKYAWGLTVDAAERSALQSMLNTC
jgi:hypothetical protein